VCGIGKLHHWSKPAKLTLTLYRIHIRTLNPFPNSQYSPTCLHVFMHASVSLRTSTRARAFDTSHSHSFTPVLTIHSSVFNVLHGQYLNHAQPFSPTTSFMSTNVPRH
jgi:hypothetical protein